MAVSSTELSIRTIATYHRHILEHENPDMTRPIVIMPPVELAPFMS